MMASDWSICNCVLWYSVGKMAEAARKTGDMFEGVCSE